MTEEPKSVGLTVLKIRLGKLISADPVVTRTAHSIAEVLLDEMRGANEPREIGRKEIGARVNKGPTQVSEALSLLWGRRWLEIRRRKHHESEYSFPLLADEAALNAAYQAMIQEVRKPRQDVRISGHCAPQDVRKSERHKEVPESLDVRNSDPSVVRKSGSPLFGNPNGRSTGSIYSPWAPPSEEAHRLLKRLAIIGGLPRHQVMWPEAWRKGQGVMQELLDSGFTSKLCERIAIRAMRRRILSTGRDKLPDLPDGPEYFRAAIRDEKAAASERPTPPAKQAATSVEGSPPRPAEMASVCSQVDRALWMCLIQKYNISLSPEEAQGRINGLIVRAGSLASSLGEEFAWIERTGWGSARKFRAFESLERALARGELPDHKPGRPKGTPKTGGRPRGVRNKIGRRMLADAAGVAELRRIVDDKTAPASYREKAAKILLGDFEIRPRSA